MQDLKEIRLPLLLGITPINLSLPAQSPYSTYPVLLVEGEESFDILKHTAKEISNDLRKIARGRVRLFRKAFQRGVLSLL